MVADQLVHEQKARRPKTPTAAQRGRAIEPLIGLIAAGELPVESVGAEALGAALEQKWRQN